MNHALRRRYGRLMLAYPRAYRREHGAEIVTTLMDAAGPGRERPTAGEVRDLLLGGLRQRFRLPVGRLMMLAAVLTALTGGALGAAAGSAAGWATRAAAPPTDAAVAEVAGLAVGGSTWTYISRQPEAYGLRYQIMAGLPTSDVPWSAEQSAARLEAAGWRVYPAVTGTTDITYMDADGATTRTARTTALFAQRDGILIDVSAVGSRDGGDDLALHVVPAEPAPVLPLTLLGAALGLVGGWLLVARLGYRLRRARPWQRAAIGNLAGAAWLLLALPSIGVYYLAWRTVSGLAHSSVQLSPAAYNGYVYDLGLNPFAAAGLPLAAVVVVLALAARPRPPVPDQPDVAR
ncbi:hypothetical protein KZZ52_31590 [Dactylosporangium sp. AC04546]|uniref:hypothetical protein n=1 Tax=Dactylosporangium sp. AC04546 TaxID=2862460 RepID=UPI001EDF4A15|nr:hypothetical protein [Dactylosporangium sp. AC04546]WVK78535.1 hypothetical protein KZZ52_31590 [Dactylosporangium sp. AC04546]